ncbi:hypothetical protein FZEAL_1441 [Fusarium zealandicum]|uniref:NAD(P)-binding protein n=1 Tax=Fusarium zealandicum TaxID=1053134 RepID=A0A8H4USN9_9HYPO|nr:hypothetical protein FZEAL_1441 [Fusarium zealandicum]
MGLTLSSPRNVLSPGSPSPQNAYALITGATSGIGRDLADDLCQRGLNVIIHGRDDAKVERVVQQLRDQHPSCEVKGLVLDAATAFSASGEPKEATWNALAWVKDVNLKVLVNNVGVGHDPTKDFVVFTDQTPASANSSDPSFIINSGSLAEQGLPWISVYSGTKAYIMGFSKGLDTELKGEGQHVEVISALIGDTDSDGHKVGTSLFTPSSKAMAGMILDSAAGAGSVPYRLLQKGMIYNVAGLREKNGPVRKKQA